MTLRLVLAVLLGLLAGLYEVGAVPFLPAWAGFRPVIPLLALTLVSSRRSRALAFVIGAALAWDAYVLGYFDVAILRLPATVFVLGWIADRFLTNRSVYAAAALAVVARFADWIGAGALSFAAVLFNLHDALWLPPQAPGFVLLWDVVCASFGFLVLASFTGRFASRPTSPYAPR